MIGNISGMGLLGLPIKQHKKAIPIAVIRSIIYYSSSQ